MGGDSVKQDPLARFEAEHRNALDMLNRLEQAANGLAGPGPHGSTFAAMYEMLGVLRTEVREHNDNEELALFPFLGVDAPVAPFIEEHVTLRGLEADLARALDSGDAKSAAVLARDIVYLLRGHIQREDEVLFPMARAILGEAGLRAVTARLHGP